MPPTLDDLVPEFRPVAARVLEICRAQGVEVRVNETVRDPFHQARLWRQSRTIEQIQTRIAQFRGAGAEFLAHCLESVGPQHGDHVTNAPPGLSWHQWGEALDCFWVVNGKAEWSTTRKVDGKNGFRVYAAAAASIGADAGGLWPSFKDWPHVQLRAEGSPADVFSLQEISDVMRERFG